MLLGIAQTNPTFGERDGNIERALETLGRERADLWVLPEFFATGYQFTSRDEVAALAEPVPDGPTTKAIAGFCGEHGCHVVAGLPESADDAVYNAAVVVGPDGFVSCYRKIHLFGEEKSFFAPGDRPFAVDDLGSVRVGVMVCFDHLFPESARSLAVQGAEVIAHPSNLIIPDLAQRTMTVRALENGVFTATANRVGEEARSDTTLHYTGQSQIISPKGEVLVRLSADHPETGVVEIDPSEARSKRLTSRNDKLGDRRPSLYRL
ncbi:nitrilase-related carbon-nitrogen hydrolase [Candidatus Bipolaricaulota bacterium]